MILISQPYKWIRVRVESLMDGGCWRQSSDCLYALRRTPATCQEYVKKMSLQGRKAHNDQHVPRNTVSESTGTLYVRTFQHVPTLLCTASPKQGISIYPTVNFIR